MILVGQGINRLFDWLVLPVAAVPSLALVFLSVLAAVTALLIFKFTTNQKKLAAARDRLVGHIYEMGLYQDHLSQLAIIQGRLAKANLRYVGLTLPALIVLAVPMVVFVVQLESRFAHRPLAAGETTLFSVTLRQADKALLPELSLDVPDGVTVEAGPVRSPADGTVVWRLRVDDPEASALGVLVDGKEVARRPLRPEGKLPRLSPSAGSGWLTPLLAPGSDPLPRSGVLADMTLQLPERQLQYFGWHLNWLAGFIVFSLVGGLLMKDALGVSL